MAERFVLPLSNLFDASGNKLANGTIEFYQSGTSTPLDTYSDADLSVTNDNPVDLDANGLPDTEIFLRYQPYKVVVKTSAGTIVKTYDPVTPPMGRKGADTASATTVVVGTDGDFSDMTGTTTVAGFTIAAGRDYTYQFDGALTLTHHATNLILPGGVDYTTVAGDILRIRAYAANQVRARIYPAAGIGRVLQVQTEVDAVLASGTTVMPSDDTIPQITEGNNFIPRTGTFSFTPRSANSTLYIEAMLHLSSSAATQVVGAALFKDGAASAIATGITHQLTATFVNQVRIFHKLPSPGISAFTLNVRGGAGGAGTCTLNRDLYGDTAFSYLKVTEVL